MELSKKSAASNDTRSNASPSTETTQKAPSPKNAKFHVGSPSGVLATASQTAHITLGAKTHTASTKSLLKRHLSRIDDSSSKSTTSTAAATNHFRPITPQRAS